MWATKVTCESVVPRPHKIQHRGFILPRINTLHFVRFWFLILTSSGFRACKRRTKLCRSVGRGARACEWSGSTMSEKIFRVKVHFVWLIANTSQVFMLGILFGRNSESEWRDRKKEERKWCFLPLRSRSLKPPWMKEHQAWKIELCSAVFFVCSLQYNFVNIFLQVPAMFISCRLVWRTTLCRTSTLALTSWKYLSCQK